MHQSCNHDHTNIHTHSLHWRVKSLHIHIWPKQSNLIIAVQVSFHACIDDDDDKNDSNDDDEDDDHEDDDDDNDDSNDGDDDDYNN